MSNSERPGFWNRALIVSLYALAMAYLEAAVVVYFQRALKISPGDLFPIRNEGSLGGLAGIELGREVATMVMLATVGWLAGRSGLERLAWTSVAFGLWDLGYYLGLWVFIGWPFGFGTFDLLFLIPVPWVSPVWAPMTVSLALISVGLIVARRLRLGEKVNIRPWNIAALVCGGLVVIVSFTLDARHILDGGIPTSFAWPVFVAGMALAVAGAAPLCRSSTSL